MVLRRKSDWLKQHGLGPVSRMPVKVQIGQVFYGIF